MPGFGDLHHPVSTRNAQAQMFFDQGLRMIYGFNHDEAARSFQHAVELDPKQALLGLRQTLKQQSKDYDAGFMENEWRASWKGSAPLKLEDLL